QEDSRPYKRVTSCIAVSIKALGRCECCWVKPPRTVRVRDVRIADLVRSHGIEICIQQRRIANISRERHTRGGRGDTAEFPATGHEIRQTIDIRAEALTMSEWEGPDVGY